MEATRSVGDARTLGAKYYTAAEIYDLETERIFNGHWLCVGRESEIVEAGSCLPVQVEGESLLLARDNEHQLHGFFNVCRHRGTRLCEESVGKRRSIVCPYHGWTYGFNGKLLSAPNMTESQCVSVGDLGLKPVATASWCGFVFVNFSADCQFEMAYQPLGGKFDKWSLDELVPVSRRVYDVQANWKLIFQNYNECYHCPRIHPALNLLSSYRTARNDLEEGPFLGGPMQLSDGVSSMSTTGQACAQALPRLTEIERRQVYYYSLFPTLLLSPHPDYVLVHRIERQSLSLTRVVCEFLFHPQAVAAPGFDPSPAIEFWDQTNQQDWHVCELSQQGIASRAYVPGPYSDLESTVAAFDRHYLESLREPRTKSATRNGR